MRVITWNAQKASGKDSLWDVLTGFDSDIALLQEVMEFPDDFSAKYSILHKLATKKTGDYQKFGTAIAVKGEIISEITLRSDVEWIDEAIGFFEGNLLGAVIETNTGVRLNVVSAYSPHWPVNKEKLEEIDTTGIQLDGNPDVWCTEALWCGLRDTMPKHPGLWVVGGDLNASVLFDIPKNRGNRQLLERLADLGMTECLCAYQGQPTPTFKHSRGSINHQLDYLFVSNGLFQELEICEAGKQEEIFGKKISDHLPVVADFRQ